MQNQNRGISVHNTCGWFYPPIVISQVTLFFLKRFIAQKIQRDTQGYKIVPLTNLP
jgi:hypothetical protein